MERKGKERKETDRRTEETKKNLKDRAEEEKKEKKSNDKIKKEIFKMVGKEDIVTGVQFT